MTDCSSRMGEIYWAKVSKEEALALRFLRRLLKAGESALLWIEWGVLWREDEGVFEGDRS